MVDRKIVKDNGCLSDQLSFEKFISDLSARFVNLSYDKVDGEIESAMQGILDFFQVDRCGLLGLTEDRHFVKVTHACYREGIERVSGDINLTEIFPWSYEMLFIKALPVVIEEIDQMPENADIDRISYHAMGIKSTLDIPVHFENEVSYVVVIQAMKKTCKWHKDYIPRLRLLAEIFVNALERRNADRVLRESEARLKLATDAARVMPWTIDINSGELWTTESAREYFGFESNIALSIDNFLSIVQLEDRQRVINAIELAVQTRGYKSVEYRVLCPSGGIRWVYSQGQVYPESLGKSSFLMGVTIDITKQKLAEQEITEAYKEIERLNNRLKAENIYLRKEIDRVQGFKDIIGSSDAIKYVGFRIKQVAATDTTVLILGETGTGKGLVARAIHKASKRRDLPMIVVNCAALPHSLIESELFGRERGAFTGAQAGQIGRFELADKGTIFLDEIGELPIELQAKLLRVIEDGEFERLGSPHTIRVNVRIIASTNRDLYSEVENGRFREDLFYRLNVFPVTMPPLRQRREDIPMLVRHFIEKHSKRMGKNISDITSMSMEALQRADWYGNVRELENVIERSLILTNNDVLNIEDLHCPIKHCRDTQIDTEDELHVVEKAHILKVLGDTKWRIEGSSGAANILGLKPSTLRSRMKKMGIKRRK